MTKNMKRMRSEVIRAILICFPKEYLDMVFVGGHVYRNFCR